MFANETRRIRAKLLLTSGQTFGMAYITTNGWGRSTDIYNTLSNGLRFATLDRVRINDGLLVIDDNTNKLNPDWEVGILSAPASSSGDLDFYVIVSFSAIPLKEIRFYWNSAYGNILGGTVKCYYQGDLVYSNNISSNVILPSVTTIDQIRIDISKTDAYRRVNLLEVSLRIFSGFECDESRISEIHAVEDICGTQLGQIVEKQISIKLRNEDLLFSEAYIPQWGRADSELLVKIYDEDEEIVYNKLILLEFIATKLEAKITATDVIRKLKEPLYATAPDNSSLESILNILADYYGVSFSYPSYFSTTIVPIPILGKTGYDTLKEIALATGTLCWSKRDSTIVFEDIGQGSNYYLNVSQVLSSSKRQADDFLYNNVSVNFFNVELEQSSTILTANITLNGEEEFEFDFKNPYKNVSAEVVNCTIQASQIGNYGSKLRLSGTGTATVTFEGQKVKFTKASISKRNTESTTIYGDKKLNISSHFIQTMQEASNLADKMLDIYSSRSLLMVAKTVHPYNVELNDIISYGTFEGAVTRLEIDLHNGLTSKIEVVKSV